MHSFPELIKEIRDEAGLTQAQFAKAVDVSTVLIAMVESGQKDVSKNLLRKIAASLRVHPASITPFLYHDDSSVNKLSSLEKQLVRLGTQFQKHLIEDRAKLLREYGK